jgi:hypothetical protein
VSVAPVGLVKATLWYAIGTGGVIAAAIVFSLVSSVDLIIKLLICI